MTTDTVAAWLLIGVYGLFTGCTDGVGKAWISSLVGTDLQASAQGVFQGASGFAVLAAGLWAGFLWGADGRLPLLISGVVGGVFALALLALSVYDRTGTSSSTSSSAKGGVADADHRVAALRRALGDAGLGGAFADRQPHLLRQIVVGQCVENRSLPVVSAVDRIEVPGQPHPDVMMSSPMCTAAGPSYTSSSMLTRELRSKAERIFLRTRRQLTALPGR